MKQPPTPPEQNRSREGGELRDCADFVHVAHSHFGGSFPAVDKYETDSQICAFDFMRCEITLLLFIMTGMARDGLDSRALCRTESRCLHFMLNGK